MEYVNPAMLWGAQNEHFEVFKKQFPKLKIVARGNEVKVLGDEQEIALFKAQFDKVVSHIERYNNLTSNDVDSILGSPTTVTARAKKNSEKVVESSGGGEPIVFGPNGIVVKARTANQRRMVESILQNDILFAIGPAGTGKTYTAVALAVRALRNKEGRRIIFTRPAVEACEHLGFLPGDLKEKVDPYLRILYDELDNMLHADKLILFHDQRAIEVAQLAFMRGRTLDNSVVILDEGENTPDLQNTMFLTLMDPAGKFIGTHDV